MHVLMHVQMHVLMYVPPDLNPSDSLIASPYSVFSPPRWGGSTCIQHTQHQTHKVHIKDVNKAGQKENKPIFGVNLNHHSISQSVGQVRT
jgi:hypothetical protein